jgi:uncharacterized membrane protein YbhN (UPF0104 family)
MSSSAVRLTHSQRVVTLASAMASAAPATRSTGRAAIGVMMRVARVVVPALVFGYLFTRIDARALLGSLRALPISALLGALALFTLALTIGFIRWRALLSAYGAKTLPSYPESGRIFCGAILYNLLPGAVGGDLYRGYATRHCFADSAATRSVSVVFIERVFGFAGLLVLASATSLLGKRAEPQVLFYSAIGLCAAIAAVLALSLGRRLGPWLPHAIAKRTDTLPAIEHVGPFVLAIGLSILTHIVVSLAGHVLISSLAPSVTLAESLANFPLVTLASYFPFTVAGAGPRDVVLVMLFAKLGVPRESALATSLAILACNLILSGLAGLLHSGLKLPSSARTESQAG